MSSLELDLLGGIKYLTLEKLKNDPRPRSAGNLPLMSFMHCIIKSQDDAEIGYSG